MKPLTTKTERREKFKQFAFQQDAQFLPSTNVVQDFSSSPTKTRVEKDFDIHGLFGVTRNEFNLNMGQKIKATFITQPFSSTYSIPLNDFLVAVRDVGVARTVKLPNPSLAGIGKLFTVKDASGSAASTTITISPFSTETIDGDTTKVIATNFGSTQLYTDGTNWFSL